MKTLYLIRHAKSSWKDITLNDFDRPLNKRGKLNADLMGNLLATQGIRPDLILSSPANRAMSTAKKLAESIGYSSDGVQYKQSIYEAGLNELLGVIHQVDDSVNRLFLIGHNPSLNSLLDYLVPQNSIDNIVTAGIAEIQLRVNSWGDTAQASGELMQFEYPKKHY